MEEITIMKYRMVRRYTHNTYTTNPNKFLVADFK
jgi:hypothetical protein